MNAYRVNYQFANSKGNLTNRAIVIFAESADRAREIAHERVKLLKMPWYDVTSVRELKPSQ